MPGHMKRSHKRKSRRRSRRTRKRRGGNVYTDMLKRKAAAKAAAFEKKGTELAAQGQGKLTSAQKEFMKARKEVQKAKMPKVCEDAAMKETKLCKDAAAAAGQVVKSGKKQVKRCTFEEREQTRK